MSAKKKEDKKPQELEPKKVAKKAVKKPANKAPKEVNGVKVVKSCILDIHGREYIEVFLENGCTHLFSPTGEPV